MIGLRVARGQFDTLKVICSFHLVEDCDAPLYQLGDFTLHLFFFLLGAIFILPSLLPALLCRLAVSQNFFPSDRPASSSRESGRFLLGRFAWRILDICQVEWTAISDHFYVRRRLRSVGRGRPVEVRVFKLLAQVKHSFRLLDCSSLNAL